MVNVLPNVLQLFHFMSSNSNQLEKLKTVNPTVLEMEICLFLTKVLLFFCACYELVKSRKKNSSFYGSLANSI